MSKQEVSITIAVFSSPKDRKNGSLDNAKNIIGTFDNPTNLYQNTRAKPGECLGFFDQYGKQFASFDAAIVYLSGKVQAHKGLFHVDYIDEKGWPIKPPGT